MEYYMFNGLNKKDSNKPKKQLNKKKVRRCIIIIICILLFFILTIMYNNNDKCREILDKYLFRKEVNENNLPKIEIDSSKGVNAYAYDKYIVLLEQNMLRIYDKSAHEEKNLDIEISNPLFEAGGKYLLIAEKNGRKVYCISNKNVVWQRELEGNINSISVNKNGYVSIVVSGTSYRSIVITYDSKGNELFTTYLATTNVIDTDISNDNKYLAIAEANFSGIIVQSNVKIISIDDAKKQADNPIKFTYIANSNDLIVNIHYNSKNKLVCMYDEHIDIMNESENTQIIDLKDQDTVFADITLTDKVVKIIKKSTGLFSSEAELKIINSNSQKEITYTLDSVPKELYVQDDMIGINLGTSVLFINSNGWLVKRYQSSHEIQKVILCNNIAGIISKDKIEIISL